MTAEELASAIRRHPRYYASLAGLPEQVERMDPRVRTTFTELDQIFPDAAFPAVYFFVGNLEAGGLTRPVGLLIAVETFGRTSQTDLGEFQNGHSLQELTDLPHLVAHELAHFQQALVQGVENYRAVYGDRQSLLALAIREGSADFLAELISGGHTNDRAHSYGMRHEDELWATFSEAMMQREPGDWMWTRPANPAWPPDLGYFIGYRITQAYYEAAPDKARAVHEILGVTDYERFLESSGYADRPRRTSASGAVVDQAVF
ncbi:MAG: hypothetical protein ACREK5_07595 [Gemmatimonadota bacterium]